MGSITVLNPVASSCIIEEIDSHMLRDLTGIRVAVLDNTKPNAVEIMERIAQIMVAEHGAASYDVFRKLSAAQGASEEQYRTLAANYDLVITGSGDCGGCTSWSALDAVELERRGLTTVLLVTDAFVPLAKTLVAREGAPDLRMAEIAHPIGGQATENMKTVGENVVASIIESLAQSRDELALQPSDDRTPVMQVAASA